MTPNSAHLHTDTAVHNSDHNIDRALAGLRDAQPRSGLNSRILASLEQRDTLGADANATNPGGLPFHGFIVKGWGIVCGSKRENPRPITHLVLWATTAAILAITSVAVVHYSAPTKNTVILSGASQNDANKHTVILSEARSAQSKAGTPSSVLCSMGCKDPEVASVTTDAEPFSPTKVKNHANPSHLHPPHPHAAAAGLSPRNATTTNPADPDAQALADLHAPSHPAPPLPLTPQEKLFLRVLRYGNATQLAELNPLVRAQQDAAETTAFKSFFPDPPPLDQSNGDTE